MQVTKINSTNFKSITPIRSDEKGFNALRLAASQEGKRDYLLNDPNWRNAHERKPDEKYTRYLITGKDYKKYAKMPICKQLFNAGIYDSNRVPVSITKKSKTIIQKLIKRI